MRFPKKNLNFFKILNGSKTAVECDWNSQISQDVHNLFLLKKKNTWVFIKKVEFSKNR